MFTPAYKAAENCHSDGTIMTIPSQFLPSSYSFSQLHDELTGSEPSSKTRALEHVLVLGTCLDHPSRLSREAGDEDAIISIASWISNTVLPDGSIISHDNIPSDSQTTAIKQALETTQRLGISGLKCLQTLLSFRSSPADAIGPEILFAAIAFTSSRDEWTSTPSQSIATSILSAHADLVHAPELIIGFLLQTVIRPLFSKSKPAAITATGRKAMPSAAPPRDYNISDSFDPAQKPWKYTSPSSITVFEWAAENSSEAIVAQSWNLFIPPLLTLLDDSSTPIRARGLSILASFIPKMGGKLLKQTGLGEVFEEAVMPTLTFLPTITPVDESIQLLEPAYDALFVLADARWEFDRRAESGRERESQQQLMKFYDRIMRKGILTGYLHAHEHLIIVELLTKEIGVLVTKMGVHAVKHLKDILPILSLGLTDPFASSPQQSLTTINTLKSVMLACWPRLSEPVHRRTILKSLVVSWKNLEGHKADQDELKKELRDAAQLFVRGVEATQPTGTDIDNEVLAVVEADPYLGELFGL